MNHIKDSLHNLERRHPHIFLLLALILCFALFVAASALMHGCAPSVDQGDGQAMTRPPFAALNGVQLEGAGDIKARAELEIAGEEVVVIIQGFALGAGEVVNQDGSREATACATVTFQWGFVRFTQNYPQGCKPQASPQSPSPPSPSSDMSPIVNP